MALKNEDTSELGSRLFLLMKEKGLDSPKELAVKLYERGLVQVKTRENDNDDERDRNNAIISIEKKIVRHIKSGRVSDQQGDYLLAYCKFFDCSADYILGLTQIRSADIEVRRICQLLGLSEPVVIKLIQSHAHEDSGAAGCWSLLMESNLFYSIPGDMVAIADEWRMVVQKEGEIRSLVWEQTQVAGPEKMDLALDIEGIQGEANSKRSAFYGMLSKMSRNIEEFVEQYIWKSYSKFAEKYEECMMNEAKSRHPR